MNIKVFAVVLMMTSLNLLAFSSCQSDVFYQIQFTSEAQTVEITSLNQTILHLHHDGKYNFGNHMNPLPDYRGLLLLSSNDGSNGSQYVISIDPSIYPNNEVVITGGFNFWNGTTGLQSDWTVIARLKDRSN